MYEHSTVTTRPHPGLSGLSEDVLKQIPENDRLQYKNEKDIESTTDRTTARPVTKLFPIITIATPVSFQAVNPRRVSEFWQRYVQKKTP